jgi:hypothetical protein
LPVKIHIKTREITFNIEKFGEELLASDVEVFLKDVWRVEVEDDEKSFLSEVK